MKSENIYIIHTETAEQENALKPFIKALKIKFEVTQDKSYNEEFVKKIRDSRQEVNEGKTTQVNKRDLKDFLGLYHDLPINFYQPSQEGY